MKGIAKDYSNGRPIAECEVLLAPSNFRTSTNSDGEFFIPNLRPGRHVLTISHTGFHPYIFEQVIAEDKPLYEITVELKPSETGETTREYLEEQPRYKLPEVTVLTTRASAGHPVTYTNLKREEIAKRNYGQDLPLLLTELPNVTAYSDGGNGIGYSYLRMRGFGQNRVAVQLNGVPLNDAGTGEVFWIDLPDFASDLEDMQVQRGIGSSLYGPAAFGGTINIVTRTPGTRVQPSLRAEGTLGAWNTRRAMVSFESGRIQKKYGIAARLTRMKTDGYRDNSWADLWSYYLSAARFSKKHTTRVVFYGGPEKTHLAYDGITKEQMAENRRYNPLTYPGEIDNFFQPHYELHDEFRVSEKFTLNNSLYLFRGDGYYDQYRTDQDPAKYFFGPQLPTELISVLRRRNVGETDWGWIPRLSVEHGWGETAVGGELRMHEAQHEGLILWCSPQIAAHQPDYHYYDYRIQKRHASAYVHNLFRVSSRLRVMADLQLRYVSYEMDRDKLWNVTWKKDWGFLAPRIGVNYDLLKPGIDENLPAAVIYANVSEADREPTYKDIYDPQDYWSLPTNASNHFANGENGGVYTGGGLVPELMDNVELGTLWQYRGARLGVNDYWMRVKDEIVPYGTLDDLGVPVTGNAPRTLHSGVEIVGSHSPLTWLDLSGNLALTDHHFVNYKEYDWNTSELVKRDGNRLAYDPPYIANLRAQVSRWNLNFALSLQAVGKQYVDNTENNNTAVPAYALLHVDLGYRFTRMAGTAKYVELRLRVNNLLDKEYESFGFIGDYGPSYIVGAPRALYTTLAVEL
ncbi:TonB-dependent receptor [candidate division KSB1 bacterium]|nr:MAG: TonB-dependent receptor [candidate division KSB1 bacterium]